MTLSPKSTQPPLCLKWLHALKLHGSCDVTQKRTLLLNCNTHSVLPWALWIKFSHGTFGSMGHHREPTGKWDNAVLGQMERVSHSSLQRLTLLSTKLNIISDSSCTHYECNSAVVLHLQFFWDVHKDVSHCHRNTWYAINTFAFFSPFPVLPASLIFLP